MENKKFFLYYFVFLIVTLMILGVGLSNALINTVEGYELCQSKNLKFIKSPVILGESPIIKCRDKNQIHCFKEETKKEVECNST